jgi:hypothetical protein
MSLDYISGERRLDRRYAFEMELRFHFCERGVACFGAGVTSDLSGGGVRFQTDTPPPVGADTELRIAWPFLLQGSCALELAVWGTILSSGAGGTVLKMRRYEFRTLGERSFSEGQEFPEPIGITA